MNTFKTVYLGISQLGQRLSFCIASLDGNLRLTALQEGSLEEALTLCQTPEAAVVTLNFARQPGQSLLHTINLKQTGRGRPPSQEANMRLCEMVLRRHGIKSPSTPSELERCSLAAQQGFIVARRLLEDGFQTGPLAESPRQLLETYAEAVYRFLLGAPLLNPRTLEGRIQRQLLLFEQGLRIADPMDFFEEITRHRLMQGNLPLNILYSLPELDALTAAYMAWRSYTRPPTNGSDWAWRRRSARSACLQRTGKQPACPDPANVLLVDPPFYFV